MKKSPASLLAVPLAASVLLAGCGGDAKSDSSSPSTTGSPPPTTSSAPTTTSAASAAPGPKADPNIPAAARAHTPDGAEAFVRYFYDQVNKAWESPKLGQIAPLGLPNCKTCQQYESAVAGMVSKKQHYEGDAFSVSLIGSLGDRDVLVDGAQKPGRLVASDGSIVETKSDTDKAKFIASLGWSTLGWRVAEIRVVP